jgi:DEAD/DEAH box helicase domain-containing protein
MTACVTSGLTTMLFCKVRKVAELVLAYVHAQLRSTGSAGLVPAVVAYRGGYAASERRRIEKQLFEGKLRGVVCTSALEVGVDIGSVDVVIILGYPGSISSFWQQVSRPVRAAWYGRPPPSSPRRL